MELNITQKLKYSKEILIAKLVLADMIRHAIINDNTVGLHNVTKDTINTAIESQEYIHDDLEVDFILNYLSDMTKYDIFNVSPDVLDKEAVLTYLMSNNSLHDGRLNEIGLTPEDIDEFISATKVMSTVMSKLGEVKHAINADTLSLVSDMAKLIQS